MRYIKFLSAVLMLSVPLYSYEFIGHYLDGHNAIGWSVVDDIEGSGYYIVLTGECLSTGYYACNSYDYGILRIDKRGNEMDYRVIYHYEYSDRGGEGQSMISRENSHMRVKGDTKEWSQDGCGKIVRAEDGGYYVGVANLQGADDFGWYGDIVIMKLDSGLNKEWEKEIGELDYLSELKLVDGGIMMSKGSGSGGDRMIKMDKDGNIEWELIKGAYKIMDDESGIVYTNINRVGKLSYNGDSVWENGNVSGSGGYLILNGLDVGIGWGYILGGSEEITPDSFMGYVIRTDDSGGVIWKREYPGWFWVQGIFNVGDGYVIVGSYREPTYTPIYTFILKIDTIGDIVWKRDYRDSTTIVLMNDARRTVDGGYIMTGEYTTESLYIIKTNNLGLVDGVGEGNRFRPSLPNIDYIIRSRRELAQLFKGNPGIKIYDISGREIISKPTYFNLKRGIYSYEDKRSRKRGLILVDE